MLVGGILAVFGASMLALYLARRRLVEPRLASYSAIRRADAMGLPDDDDDLILHEPRFDDTSAAFVDRRLSPRGPSVRDELWQPAVDTPPGTPPLLLVDDADGALIRLDEPEEDGTLDRARALLSAFASQQSVEPEDRATSADSPLSDEKADYRF